MKYRRKEKRKKKDFICSMILAVFFNRILEMIALITAVDL